MKDKVESKEKAAATVHDFTDYTFSVAVHKDFPVILKMYARMLDFLYQHGKYAGVASVISEIEESRLIMEMQYSYYEKVYARKGKVK